MFFFTFNLNRVFMIGLEKKKRFLIISLSVKENLFENIFHFFFLYLKLIMAFK